jgi:NDP-sugar pyrophosphorylase family protein
MGPCSMPDCLLARIAVRDAILRGNPDQIFVLNADICSSFPLREMQEFHSKVRLPSISF